MEKEQNTKISLHVVLVIFTVFLSGCVQHNNEILTPTNASNETVIGALLPLTGNLSFSGQAARVVLDLAAEDIEANGIKVGLIIEDTESNPAVAIEKIMKLKESGVILVIGTDSSTELEAVKPYADENGVILISHGSTAPSLAIAGDNIFRLLPDDTHQAEALAALMWKDGIKAIVPVWRGDVWGDGLAEATKTRFESLGGTVLDDVRYDPRTDFSSELDTLGSKVSQAVSKYGKNKVAVHFIGFNEVVTVFTRSQNNSISEVKWYGSDGTAFNDDLLKNREAASFAVKTGFVNPFYSIEIKDTEERVRAREGAAHAFGIVAYDALWVAALTYIDSNKSADINVLKNTLIKTAASFNGATGSTELNEAGDRKFASYDFWVIKEKDGVFTWESTAKTLI
jgi:branched-chain amino acid transport system substrate-binding protein